MKRQLRWYEKATDYVVGLLEHPDRRVEYYKLIAISVVTCLAVNTILRWLGKGID